MIEGLRELGKTVLLTTHYMDEAQALADRVAVIAGGRIIAGGTPDDLGGRGDAASVISFELADDAAAERLRGAVAGDWAGANGRLELRTGDPTRSLQRADRLGARQRRRPGTASRSRARASRTSTSS